MKFTTNPKATQTQDIQDVYVPPEQKPYEAPPKFGKYATLAILEQCIVANYHYGFSIETQMVNSQVSKSTVKKILEKYNCKIKK